MHIGDGLVVRLDLDDVFAGNIQKEIAFISLILWFIQLISLVFNKWPQFLLKVCDVTSWTVLYLCHSNLRGLPLDDPFHGGYSVRWEVIKCELLTALRTFPSISLEVHRRIQLWVIGWDAGYLILHDCALWVIPHLIFNRTFGLLVLVRRTLAIHLQWKHDLCIPVFLMHLFQAYMLQRRLFYLIMHRSHYRGWRVLDVPVVKVVVGRIQCVIEESRMGRREWGIEKGFLCIWRVRWTNLRTRLQ